MNAIIDKLLNANTKMNAYLQDEFDDMFRRFGPAQVVTSPEIWTVDFDLPSATAQLREVLAVEPKNARLERHSPFMNRTADSHISGKADTRKPLNNTHGLYVILTDYPPITQSNTCNFKVEGLTAIYRGESDKVRDRLMGHIFQDLYRRSLRPSEVPWPSFMRVDGINGINIDQKPYQDHKWMVVVYPLPGCGSSIRRQAELAFDRAFGMPPASSN